VRRSPRVAATVQTTVSSKRVSSTGKSRVGNRKRKIDVDETYVPDAAEDGVAAGKVIFVCPFLHNCTTVNFFFLFLFIESELFPFYVSHFYVVQC
jgi:hypothetical protein